MFCSAALPTPLKIFTKTREKNPAASCIHVCETAAFYPENFTLNWYKNGNETTSEIKIETKKNAEGLYMVSSSLIARPPFQSDNKYTCLITHVSLNTPAQAVIAGSECNQGTMPPNPSPVQFVKINYYFYLFQAARKIHLSSIESCSSFSFKIKRPDATNLLSIRCTFVFNENVLFALQNRKTNLNMLPLYWVVLMFLSCCFQKCFPMHR